MKFFVYGRLKSDEKKSWMIPFSNSKPCRIPEFKMFRRKDGAACVMRGEKTDSVVGELREAKWADLPILGWLLLKFLDLNEGTSWGVYKRIKVSDFWIYIYTGNRIKNWTVIKEWHEIGGKQNVAIKNRKP
jgi:hypothetical protein